MGKVCFTKPELDEYGIDNMSDQQKRKFIEKRLADTQLAKRNNKLQAIVVNGGITDIMTHPKGAKAGLKAYLYTDRTEMFQRSSIDAKFEAYKAANQSKVYEMMGDLMPTMGGLRTNPKQQKNLVYALFGEAEKTNSGKWQDMSGNWFRLVEDLKARYLKAGGNPSKTKNWSIPQSHAPEKLTKAGFDKWYNDIINLLDTKAMGISKAEAPEALRLEYDRMAKGNIEPTTASFGEGVAQTQFDESQFIKFKDADSWMKYNEDYSDSTPYMMMMDILSTRSSEIILMEHFGPNTDLGFNAIAKHVEQTDGAGSADFARMAYDNLAGHLNAPTSRRKTADAMQALRSATTGLKLPAAALSVMSDVAFNTLTAGYNGIPAMKVVRTFIANLKPEKAADRKFAAQLHFTLDHMLDEATSASRFSDVQGRSVSSRFSTSVMRLSLLQTVTIAGKKGFHFEFMAHLATDSFGNRTKQAFKRYGVNANDIAEMKNSKKIVRNGVEYLDPNELSQGAAERVMSMLSAESKYAVPEADLMVKTAMNQGTKKGTVGGEAIRFAAQFKTFPATIIANHWMRAINGFEGSVVSRTAYASGLITLTTMIGAAVLQLKEIAKGNTPRDADNVDFWTDAMLQGGAFSIIGDILSSDSRSFGGSVQEFLMGPAVGLTNEVIWKGLLGSKDDALDSLLKGEIDLSGVDNSLAGVVANNFPYQFWYTKALMDRMFLDGWKKFSDPKWELKKAKKEAKRQQEYGNKRYF